LKVIFNADDFGLSKGVNLGIIESYQCGPVRSATIMAGTPGFKHAVELAKVNPGLNVGIHLAVSAGKSVGGTYKTITDSEGRFLRLLELESKAKEGTIDLDEVEAEFEAQIEKVLAAGIKPDHFDTHHHVHNLPGIITVYLKLVKKYGVAARFLEDELYQREYEGVKTTEKFSSEFYGDCATPEDLRRMLSSCNAESFEIMSHPAFVDYDLYTASSYNTKRAYELSVLTSPEIMDFIKQNGYELCSYSEI
jgi:predicted glycoside hydrolase/deacetylase ChbG (UPF0249 family)